MKIQLQQHDFQAAAAHLGRGFSGPVRTPILAGVLVEADTGQVRLSAFDFEVSLVVDVTASVDVPGRVLVPGRLLTAIAKVLPNKPVTLTLEDKECVRLRCGAGEYVLPTMPIEDYPQLPALPTLVGEIPADAFADAVEQVATVASPDQTLLNLTAVLVEASSRGLRLMATDRFRMAVKDVPWQAAPTGQDVRLLVPADSLRSFARGLPLGTVTLHADSGSGIVGLSDGTRHTTMRTLDVELVPYEQILAGITATIAVTVETTALLDATKRLAVFAADEKHGPFTLAFLDDGIEVTANSTQLNLSSGREPVPATIATPDGEPIHLAEPIVLGMQARFLQHALACVGARQVRLDVTSDRRPALIRPVADNGVPDDTYRHLVMPVRRA